MISSYFVAAWISLLVGFTLLTPNGSLLYITMEKVGGPYALATLMVGVALLMFCSKLLPGLRITAGVLGAFVWAAFVAFYAYSLQPRPIAAVAAVLLGCLVADIRHTWLQNRQR